ncbi:acyltransferase domain-containing protein [Micromonospora vinacea]|uniref:acyltransferase domain-containing protein n=1 Tax=Micromonospora vinacea TaxID=709878 RepID=UPI003CF12130|nr:polyketide synthase dehydratase domain-containing protein [Micromonospora sp. NBC_00821]
MRTSWLRVSHAFHSALVEPALDELRAVADGLRFAPPTRTVVSDVTGAVATAAELTSLDYWVRHAREAVRFRDGVRTALDRGVDTFAELGGTGALIAMVHQCTDETPMATVSLLGRPADDGGPGEPTRYATALARLHVTGHVPPPAVPNAEPADLPTFPFRRARSWRAAPVAAPGAHPVLAVELPVASTGDLLLHGTLSVAAQPWLADHVVAGRVVVPGAAMLETVAYAAGRPTPRAGPGVAPGISHDVHVRGATTPHARGGGVADFFEMLDEAGVPEIIQR